MCKRFVTAAVFLSAVFLWATAARAEGVCYQVVVHAENPAAELDAKQLGRMMLRKTRRWDNGTAVVPVDRESDSAVRESFTQAVLGKSPAAIESYWQRMIFSGRAVPPEQAASDDEVLARVRADPGAVGYVRCTALPAEGVRILPVKAADD